MHENELIKVYLNRPPEDEYFLPGEVDECHPKSVTEIVFGRVSFIKRVVLRLADALHRVCSSYFCLASEGCRDSRFADTMGRFRAMEIGALALVMAAFASLHLVTAEVFSTVTPAFVWSDLRYAFDVSLVILSANLWLYSS